MVMLWRCANLRRMEFRQNLLKASVVCSVKPMPQEKLKLNLGLKDSSRDHKKTIYGRELTGV